MGGQNSQQFLGLLAGPPSDLKGWNPMYVKIERVPTGVVWNSTH